MIKYLYQKSLKLAAHKSSKIYLATVSFIESSFFPIPPNEEIIRHNICNVELQSNICDD